MAANPYDAYPYECAPIEWTAPERLAITSVLHGGPAAKLAGYRVLELGCGNGANIIPMAYYRRDSKFVGVDGAGSQLDIADSRRAKLGLSNLAFVHSDFCDMHHAVEGEFDYIVAHGVCSWISGEALQSLLRFCGSHLAPSGLLYLNYNAKPGWNIRGMVRDFLMEATALEADLRTRTRLAKDISARTAELLADSEHHYSRLLANEFRFVCDSGSSYVAHEFLSTENNAYWRSEFLRLAASHGLAYVADADFNYPSGRPAEALVAKLQEERIPGLPVPDIADLLCYRQLHSPLFTREPVTRKEPRAGASGWMMASCLAPGARDATTANPLFTHPSGYEVEAKEPTMARALESLCKLWPASVRVGALFENPADVVDDLLALHRNGLIELRLVDPGGFGVCAAALNELEAQANDNAYVTSPYHVREPAPGHGVSASASGR